LHLPFLSVVYAVNDEEVFSYVPSTALMTTGHPLHIPVAQPASIPEECQVKGLLFREEAGLR
jgi:hypothetical protein